MNIEFGQEQNEFNRTLQEFFAKEWPLLRLRSSVGEDHPDQNVWQGLTELGLFAACVPLEYGGLGLTIADIVLPIEQIGFVLAPGPINETFIATDLLGAFGADSQKDAILPDVANGKAAISLALLDQPHCYAPETTTTRAERHAGGWRISGRKVLVSEAAGCNYVIVAAQEEDKSGPPSLFICAADAPEVSLRRHVTIDVATRYFEMEFVGTRALGGPLGVASRDDPVLRAHALGAVSCAGQHIGAASRTFDMGLSYVRERKQFGRTIGSFQAIKHMCADMHVLMEMSRAAFYEAGRKMAGTFPSADPVVSVAKAYIGDSCRSVMYNSLQIHGGIGYTWDYGLHLFFKRGKYLEQAFGNSTWHREHLARTLLSAGSAGAGSQTNCRQPTGV